MKKITLLGAILFGAATAFGQAVQVSELGDNNPVVIVEQNPQLAPCDGSQPGNGFENGKSCTFNLLRIVAHDVTVPDGEDLTLTTFTPNVFIGPEGGTTDAAFVDFYVWGDNGGAPDPGNLITSETGIIPASQTVVGANFGFNVWAVELDVTDVVLAGQNGSTTTYWVGISLEADDASNVFWENSTAGLIGFGEAYDDGGGGGFVIDPGLEGVFAWTADCTLGLDDNGLSQISIFPNPAVDILNVRVPSNIEINDAVIYDVLGKASPVQVINGQINVQNLSRGVYILNLNTTAGTLTQKIVKQ